MTVVRIPIKTTTCINDEGLEQTLVIPATPIDYTKIKEGTDIIMDGSAYIVEYK